MVTFDERERGRLLEAVAGERLEALYVVAVTTGMRLGELVGLRWRDVDVDKGTLPARSTIEREGERNRVRRDKDE